MGRCDRVELQVTEFAQTSLLQTEIMFAAMYQKQLIAAGLTNLDAEPLVGLRLAHQTSQRDHFQVQDLQGCHSAFLQQFVICWPRRWLHPVMLSCIVDGVMLNSSTAKLLLQAVHHDASKRTIVLPVMPTEFTQHLAQATLMTRVVLMYSNAGRPALMVSGRQPLCKRNAGMVACGSHLACAQTTPLEGMLSEPSLTCACNPLLRTQTFERK